MLSRHSEPEDEELQLRPDQLAFIEGMCDGLTITAGLERAGITRRAYKRWLEDDEDFRIAHELAEARIHDELRSEIFHRAIIGSSTLKYEGGKLVSIVRRKSDDLLKFFANAVLPEFKEARYRHLDGKREELRDAVINIHFVSVGINGEVRPMESEEKLQLPAPRGEIIEQ